MQKAANGQAFASAGRLEAKGARLAGKLWVDSLDAAAMRVSMTGEGADRKVQGNVRVKIDMAVEDAGDGASNLVVHSDANIMGKLGEFGQGIIKRKTDGIMQEFGCNLTKRMEG